MKKSVESMESGFWLIFHLIIICVIVIFNSQFSFYWWVFLGGVILIILAIIIRGSAIEAMGKVKMGVVPGGKLITGGVYSKIRHPLYLSVKFVLVGLALMLASIIGLVLIAAVVIPLHLWRQKLEEKLLLAKFGKKYVNYEKKTWF